MTMTILATDPFGVPTKNGRQEDVMTNPPPVVAVLYND